MNPNPWERMYRDLERLGIQNPGGFLSPSSADPLAEMGHGANDWPDHLWVIVRETRNGDWYVTETQPEWGQGLCAFASKSDAELVNEMTGFGGRAVVKNIDQCKEAIGLIKDQAVTAIFYMEHVKKQIFQIVDAVYVR